MGASAKNSFYKAGVKHSKKAELMLSKCTPFLALFYFDLVRNGSIYGNVAIFYTWNTFIRYLK